MKTKHNDFTNNIGSTNKQHKILFTDLDGTLLNDNKEVSKQNRDAIDLALKKGHKIVIATGRPISSARQLAWDLGLVKKGCYIIASNGSVIYDAYKEEFLFETGVPLEHVRHLLDSAYESHLHAHTYSRTNVVSEHDTKELRDYSKTIHVPSVVVNDVTKYLTYNPPKVLILHKESKQNLLNFEKKMAEFSKGKFETVFSCEFMLEYCPVGISKGTAVHHLCDILDMPYSNSIAAGDAPNDLSMIKAAGCGCVMSNGYDEVKEYADYITSRNNNESGLAEIIEHFML